MRFAVNAEDIKACMPNDQTTFTASVTQADIQALAGFDTPTIVNGLEARIEL